MALELMKISIDGTITTEVSPDSAKFFYITTTDMTSTFSIDATDFMGDDGATITELPALETDNSYFTVEINGVEQMQDIFTYTSGGAGALEVDIPTGGTIPEGQTIILHVVNFTPTSTGTFNT